MSIAYVAIMIGVLVFVHELGHFVVAKWFDVKVLSFSIGFGPKVAAFTRGETEYALRALPLGGYVQMEGMDLESTEDLPPEERARALMAKPIYQRVLVLLGGPVFNLIFPLIIYLLVTSVATTEASPALVGEVFLDMPGAEAGLQPGDRIVSIDGEQITYWHEITEAIRPNPGKTMELSFERDGQLRQVEITPERKPASDFLGLGVDDYGMIGIQAGTFGPTVVPTMGGPAAAAGLQRFDRVIVADGVPVKRFDELAAMVRKGGGKPIDVVALRPVPIPVEYGQFYEQTRFETTITPRQVDGVWELGVAPSEMFISAVDPDSPAAKAGLKAGDQLVSVDGKAFSNWRMLNEYIQVTVSDEVKKAKEEGRAPGDVIHPLTLELRRAGGIHKTTIKPQVRTLDIEDYYRIRMGWAHVGDFVYPDEVPFPVGPRVAFAARNSVAQTWQLCGMTAKALMRMASGKMSTKNLGGPIMIGELAAQAGKAGWDRFLEMMAIISINLALFNLVPIPLLDGGNIVLALLEGLKRGPLSFRTRQIATYVGFSLIIMLIVIAFKNDIERSWDNIAAYVNDG